MFQYLEYSRFALADISGINFNVAYELVRAAPRARGGNSDFSPGQVFLRHSTSARSRRFRMNTRRPIAAAQVAEFITGVLTESLVRNRLDSPVADGA